MRTSTPWPISLAVALSLVLAAPLQAQSAASATPGDAVSSGLVIASFPFTETFDAATTLPAGWTSNTGDAGDGWNIATSTSSEPFSGAEVDHTSGAGNLLWVNDSQPPFAVNTGLTTPQIDLTSTTNPRLQFWYQNARVVQPTPQPASRLDILVSTDGGATFSAPVLTVNTLVTAWTQYSVDLTPYRTSNDVRIRFLANEAGSSTSFQTSSDPSLDDVSIGESAAAPIYSVSPSDTSGPVNLGTAGFCAATTQTQQVFTISNSGAGTLAVTGASLSGSASFSFDASALPASLAAGQSVAVTVTFAPSPTATGTQTAMLTLAYNDGTARTDVLDLTATASSSNVALGTGAGYAFVNSNATCTASAATPGPAGTAFIPVTGHTFIGSADWNDGGNDSFFNVDAATLDGLVGSIRFFGRTYESFSINSNGAIGFAPNYESNPNTSPLPTSDGGGVIYVGAMDAGLTSAYDGDTLGEAAAGAYYGLANVDGVGPDELVITFFHLYDYFAPIRTRYYTAQLVVFKGAPNEDDSFEIRYPGGLDANGVPFYNQVTVGGFPPVNQDLEVGLSNPDGTAAAVYRVNGVGGPLFDPSGVAIRFTPETQAVADGGAGWRLMGAPVTGFTVARLAELNLVQGVTGQYPTAGDNLYTNYTSGAYVPAASAADALAPGQGFLWYLYDIACDPTVAPCNGAAGPPATDGTSKSYTLPMALQGTGAEAAGPVAVPLQASAFNMIANPFRSSLDVTNLASWANGGTLTSGVGQVWDPATSSYVTTTTLGNVVTAWQGMFVQNNSATSIDVPASAKTTGGTFVGRGGQAASLLGFELSGTTPDGAPTVDVAAVVAFADDATPTWDLLDTGKLTPVVDRYATAAFVGERDGTSRAQAQMSLPSGVAAQYTLPVVIEAVGTTADLTLAWPRMDNVPDTWTLELRDLVTGDVVDLRTATRYAFTVTPSAAREGTPADWAAATTLASEAGVATAARFEVVISTGNVVAGSQDMPTVFALDRVAPNPTASASTVRFAMPDAGTVSVSVYDLLGREVATLAQGEMAAGWHTATLDASRLSAGVYVVRMQAGSFQATQRMTVVR